MSELNLRDTLARLLGIPAGRGELARRTWWLELFIGTVLALMYALLLGQLLVDSEARLPFWEAVRQQFMDGEPHPLLTQRAMGLIAWVTARPLAIPLVTVLATLPWALAGLAVQRCLKQGRPQTALAITAGFLFLCIVITLARQLIWHLPLIKLGDVLGWPT